MLQALKKSRTRKYPGKAISKYLIPGIVLALKEGGWEEGVSWGASRKTLEDVLFNELFKTFGKS